MAHTPGFARLQRLFSTHLNPRLRARESGAAIRETPISRRRMLGGIAATGVVVPLGCAPSDGETQFDVRVAVVGAGMAGTHCAMRLHEAGIEVELFEASDTVGGRMNTSRYGHPENQLCELGGELVDTNHASMWVLSSELGITLDDRQDDTLLAETWWVGGVAVPDATVVEQFTAVADLFADAVVAADSDDAAYEALDLMTLAAWLDENCPAATYPELHTIITSAYRGEFGLETAEQSALNMLYLIGSDDPDPFRIFGESDERWHAHEGSDTFVYRLAEYLPEDRLHYEHALVRLARAGDGYELVFAGPDGEVTVTAERVVLAIPWTILRELDTADAGLSEEKRALIDTLGYGTNSKIMGWFTAPVWRDDHGASGSLTSDEATQQGWETSIGQAGTHGIWTNFLGGDQGAAIVDAAAAEVWFEDTVLATLEEIWPGTAAAFVPGTVTSMLWPHHPLVKASYTCYLPGQWATWATEGEPEGGIYFCGEHCSADFQGWMEGAAETGALVAAALIGELGGSASPALEQILAAKLVVEQPAFGKLSARPRWRTRRAALGEAARGLARR